MKTKDHRASVSIIVSILLILAHFSATPGKAFGQGAGAKVEEAPLPPAIDMFSLNLEQTRAFSRSRNFEVVGHSYLKSPHLTAAAQAEGVGAGFNTPRVYDGIAYLGGYNSPPTLFGILIADVRDPKDMKILSFIPCKPGTRCGYVRVNNHKKILVFGNSPHPANPDQPPPGVPPDSGWSFWNVADPEHPVELRYLPGAPGSTTHGFEIDDDFLYGCAATTPDTIEDEVQIIDYSDPVNPVQVSSLHIQGQRPDLQEDFESRDRANPDGTAQRISCHEINIHKDRLYIAYKDAGLVVVDVTDRSNPKIIGRLDYVPPFNGGSLGSAHTSAPVVVDSNEHPSLVVHTDEKFTCPPGFGRIIDVSDLQNPEVVAGERPANLQIISSYRLPHVSDVYGSEEEEFVCLDGRQSTHLPWFDYRSPSLFYQAWYDQGVRVWDISNPFLPREVGYYLSPKYASFGRVARQTREVFQEPDTGLIYVTDGNGGGLTVLRWTGPIPEKPSIPGAR